MSNGLLLPMRVVMAVFRGQLRAAIRQGLAQGTLQLPAGQSRQQVEHLRNQLGRQSWNVPIRERYPSGQGVLIDLARYLRGGPIAHSRLLACDGQWVALWMMLLAAFCLVSGSALAQGDDDDGEEGRVCSQTANLLFHACGHEVRADFLLASAKCINVSDQAERAHCVAAAKATRREGHQLCRTQLAGRRDACQLLGEGRYDPDFNPANFDDPKHPTNPNPYFPLGIGHTWECRGANEFNTVEVLNETKLIAGVTCLVVRDQVFKDGDLVENTDDWYAQAQDRNTWYCGEEVKDFESFDGDDPRRPELVSIAGSFKAGRDGDKAGIIFLASPKPGDVYLEEFSLGNAEDATVVLSTTYAFGRNAELDQFVPPQLAQHLCSSSDCVVTKNFSLLEPGVFARKYYARGIGFFLEVKPDSGEVLQLTKNNFDVRCASLPPP